MRKEVRFPIRLKIMVTLLCGYERTLSEVAQRLYISPKTADHHIQHIYTKIGVSNRAAETRWAIDSRVVVADNSG